MNKPENKINVRDLVVTRWRLTQLCLRHSEGLLTGISDALGGFESVAIGDSGRPDLNTVDQLRAPIAYSLYKGTEF